MKIAENNDVDILRGNLGTELEVLLKEAIDGSDTAFKKIYELHSGKMYSLCLRYTGGASDTDDVFQEGYIKVFKNLSTYKGAGSFEGWVRKIFVNTCLDHLKKKKSLVFGADIEANEHVHPKAEGDTFGKLENDDLMKIVQQLPGGYRSIVNLYLVEGYSHKEIAGMLHISEGTSKSQLSKARNKLQEIITRTNER